MTRSHPSTGDARIGTVLCGKYRLDRVIGIGGMAVVYRATHRNRAEFAVKMLLPAFVTREDVRARFVREGYAANSVKHPGAVFVVDDDVAQDGTPFLVMELLEGIPCDRLCGSPGKGVSPDLASAITIQLLDVLAAAHEKGTLHRDIKPANLFLTRAGVVKVLDFGIASVRPSLGAHGPPTGATLGTPSFMAPEHARGRSSEMDGRSDLWAVGATFFGLVSGELVHAAGTLDELLIAAGTTPARPLASVATGLPASLAHVIDRALAFEKGDRWPTAAAMRDALVAAHHASFGEGNLEQVIASAVARHAASDEPTCAPIVAPLETRTATPGWPRVPTERLPTSEALGCDRRLFTSRTRAVARGSAAVAIACATFWFGAHRAPTPVRAALPYPMSISSRIAPGENNRHGEGLSPARERSFSHRRRRTSR